MTDPTPTLSMSNPMIGSANRQVIADPKHRRTIPWFADCTECNRLVAAYKYDVSRNGHEHMSRIARHFDLDHDIELIEP